MIIKRQRVVKAVAIFLALSIFQLYAQVGAVAGPDVEKRQDPATSAPQNIGKLSTSGNRDILLDKNEAHTGATVISGATLETSECVTATVRWGLLDEVNLATNTIAVVEYSGSRVRVVLKQGCARLRVGPNVEGVIETPDGKSTPATQPDASNRRLAEVCYLPSGIESDFYPTCGIPPLVMGGIVGGIVAGAVGLLSLITVSEDARAENASFSAPSF
jgi:hypothetical protein